MVVEQRVTKTQSAVNTLTSGISAAAVATRDLAAAWKGVADAKAAVLGDGGMTPAGAGAPPATYQQLSYDRPSGALATIPGQGRAGYGPEPWGHVPITGYGAGGTPPGGDGGGYGGPPNFTMVPPDDGGGDAPFNDPRGNRFNRSAGHDISPFHQILFGGMAAGAAWDVVKSGYDANAELSQPEVVAGAAGMSAADQQAMRKAARELQQKYPTLTPAGAATIIGENWQQTHNLGQTVAVSDQLAQFAVVMRGLGAGDASDAMFDMTRSGELAGLLNKKDKNGNVDLTGFKSFLADTELVERVTGGNISPGDILHLFQNLGPSALMMGPEGREMTELLTLTLGQQKAGTGVNQLFKEFVGGKMSVGTEDLLAADGLIDTRGATRSGQYVTLRPGAMKDEKLFESNPTAWFANDFMPAVEKMGKDQQDQLFHALYAGTGTQTGGRAAADMVLQYQFLERYKQWADQAPDGAAAAQQFSNSPQGKAQGAGNAWIAAEAAFAAAAQPATSAGLTLFRETLNAAGNWATDHPVRAGVVDASVAVGGIAGAAIAARAAKQTVVTSMREIFGSAVADAAMAGAEAGAVGGAETGPGLLVTALVGAIVAGVGASIGGDPSAFGSGRFGAMADRFRKGVNPPAGTKSDPIYIASATGIKPGTPWTNQPSGPTGANPNLSPPAPGQASGRY